MSFVNLAFIKWSAQALIRSYKEDGDKILPKAFLTMIYQNTTKVIPYSTAVTSCV